MAKKVYTNQELCHVWVNNPELELRNSGRSLFSEDGVLYSYGRYFPLAKIHGNCLFINNSDTSPTTKSIATMYLEQHLSLSI